MPVDVTVTNPDSSSATLVGSFTYGALWTPAEITTALWLDADDASTITTVSGNVSEWRDKSGNARHATQSVSASRPSYVAGAMGGKAVMRHAGTGEFLDLTPGLNFLSNSSAHTIFAVIESSQDGQFGGIIATQNEASNAGIQFGFGNVTPNVAIYRLQGASTRRQRTSSASFTGAPVIASLHYDGSGSTAGNAGIRIFKNGTEDVGAFNEITGSGEFQKSTDHFIGIRGTTIPYDGDIAEIIILESDASSQDRQFVEGYLAHKWGLEANLPAEHPYKSAAPVITP